MLINYNNYGIFGDMLKTGQWRVSASELTLRNVNEHFIWILNIFRDGIELPELSKIFITVSFDNGIEIPLSLHDYMLNLIMWRGVLGTNQKLQPGHIFFEEVMNRKNIKQYVDRLVIDPNRSKFSNIQMNNINARTLSGLRFVNDFALYLANTINLEDDIRLMRDDPRAWEILHTSLAHVPLEEVKATGSRLADEYIAKVKTCGYHCMADFFNASEGINPKQYKEYGINIGTKPDGKGGVFPVIIDGSFIHGGLQTVDSIFIESSAGRIAQILSKINVGDAGHFARLLGLNNGDTILHKDKNYICNTKHFQKVFIVNQKLLSMYNNRWYRENPRGVEKLLTSNDTHLIGRTLYFRSPMRCASKSEGTGICYRCYGELAHTNNDINVGKIAAEILSAILTQILLSAKHLLESMIKKISWSEGFKKFMAMDANIMYLSDEFTEGELKHLFLVIDPDKIDLESDQDDFEYNESVPEFEIYNAKTNEVFPIFSSESDDMYLSGELNDIIRKDAEASDGKISIPLKTITDIPLFLVKIHNNEISATLKKLKNVINKSSVTSQYDADSFLQAFLASILEGDLNISAVHAEVILSNQIRSKHSVLDDAEWDNPNAEYQILTLHQALTDNPSIIASMKYQRLGSLLYNPLTFSPGRNKPSFLDLFFMVSPQKHLHPELETK